MLSLLLNFWSCRGLGSHFICQNLLGDICCLDLFFFPSNQAEHMQGWMLVPVLILSMQMVQVGDRSGETGAFPHHHCFLQQVNFRH